VDLLSTGEYWPPLGLVGLRATSGLPAFGANRRGQLVKSWDVPTHQLTWRIAIEY